MINIWAVHYTKGPLGPSFGRCYLRLLDIRFLQDIVLPRKRDSWAHTFAPRRIVDRSSCRQKFAGISGEKKTFGLHRHFSAQRKRKERQVNYQIKMSLSSDKYHFCLIYIYIYRIFKKPYFYAFFDQIRLNFFLVGTSRGRLLFVYCNFD